MKKKDFFQILAYNPKIMRATENFTLNEMKEDQISRRIIYVKVKNGSAV